MATLKSTYKSAAESAAISPLPEGWTEHKAPTGHSYYYNAATKQSTYTRPTAVPQPKTQSEPVPAQLPFQQIVGSEDGGRYHGVAYQAGLAGNLSVPYNQQGPFTGFHGPPGQRRPQIEDRPKSKVNIPGCAPWMLVRTKLKRRFVHNPETGESFWKFPTNVLKCVTELDRLERERRERRERGEPSDVEGENEGAETSDQPETVATGQPRQEDDSDEYEEVEVTDDEDEDGENPNKRQRVEQEKQEGPVEFNEDDIAYQLAAMGEDYGEYGEEQEYWDEGAEEPPLNEEDAKALFMDLLDDFHINPYTPWETVIEEGKIIEDDRYTCLPNTKTRKEVWSEWSRDRIQKRKEARENQAKQNPRIPYFAFLEKHATPKLYWPEFKRKFKKEPEMRDTKITDKDREKWYREYINRLKLPESNLKADLTTLLKAQPIHLLNRSTTLDTLPPAVLTDLRFISLRSDIRNPLVETYISIQPPAPEQSKVSLEEAEALAKQKQDRERREKALADRERKVQEEKMRQQKALRYGKGMLREGEEEIRRAMKAKKDGLLSHIQDEAEEKS